MRGLENLVTVNPCRGFEPSPPLLLWKPSLASAQRPSVPATGANERSPRIPPLNYRKFCRHLSLWPWGVSIERTSGGGGPVSGSRLIGAPIVLSRGFRGPMAPEKAWRCQ